MDNAKFENLMKKWEKNFNRALAKKMKKIAVRAKEMLQERLDNPYPPASRKGQYPRRRTGNLRSSVTVAPNNIPEIEANDFVVDVFYSDKGFYGNILTSEKFRRKGPADVLALKELAAYADKVMNEEIYL